MKKEKNTNSLHQEIQRMKAQIGQLEDQVDLLCGYIKNDKIKNAFLEQRILAYEKMLDSYWLHGTSLKGRDDSSIDALLENAKNPIINSSKYAVERWKGILDIIFHNNEQFFQYKGIKLNFDLACLWGLEPRYESSRLLVETAVKNVPFLFVEEGLIESVVPYNKNFVDKKYRQDHSLVFDKRALYTNSYYPSDVEMLLNSAWEMTSAELQRAKAVMQLILSNRVSKYNHQPFCEDILSHNGRPKVLVIDQVAGDQSILYGAADDDTFAYMLSAAKTENPMADIIVKTHPVTNNTVIRGHYDSLPGDGNIIKFDMDINPICLLQSVDKVYVCTSQMGFEAAMCGKEVHVFGMPFYAGWGITKDRKPCVRRMRKRSVEEIFYAMYILYSKYVSYKKNCVCGIEDAIQEILELREEYFSLPPSKSQI